MSSVTEPFLAKKASTRSSRRSETQLEREQKQLRNAVYCSLTLMCIEIVGGILANSLAIITDAAHLLSDVGGFAASIFALSLMMKKATAKYSYGFMQAGVLGAIFSVLCVWLMAGMLLVQAVRRLMDPEEIDGRLMALIATLGFVANLILMAVLGTAHHGHSHGNGDHGHGHDHGKKEEEEHGHGDHGHGDHGHGGHGDHGHGDHGHGGCDGHGHGDEEHGHGGHDHGHGGGDGHGHGDKEEHGHGHGEKEPTQKKNFERQESLAMRAAFIHVIGDLVQSAGVMVAGILIWWQPVDIGTTRNGLPCWVYADPICTFGFSILVICTTLGTINQAVRQVMMSAPDVLEPSVLNASLLNVPNVVAVHDLHLWQVGQGLICTAHVLVRDLGVSQETLHKCIEVAQDKHNIGHITFQIEVEGMFDHSKEHLRIGEHDCHEALCTGHGHGH